MRVLIVEDEINLAETLRQMLKQNRFDSDVSCGVVQKLEPGSFYIDVAYNEESFISPVGDREADAHQLVIRAPDPNAVHFEK